MALLYEALICAIPHRARQLERLLRRLDAQAEPGFGAAVCVDNLSMSVGAKRQRLLESSEGAYISFIDDDDDVPFDFVPQMLRAMAEGPDYVGFMVTHTINGSPQLPVEHSLRHQGWSHEGTFLARDISHLNPIRRELALLGRFDSPSPESPGGFGEDHRWVSMVRASGRVRTEVFIPLPMYYYRFSVRDSAFSLGEGRVMRLSPVEGPLPEVPSYPWLRMVPPA